MPRREGPLACVIILGLARKLQLPRTLLGLKRAVDLQLVRQVCWHQPKLALALVLCAGVRAAPALSAEAVGAMKVTELKAALKARGLDQNGKKAQLVERLLASG